MKPRWLLYVEFCITLIALLFFGGTYFAWVTSTLLEWGGVGPESWLARAASVLGVGVGLWMVVHEWSRQFWARASSPPVSSAAPPLYRDRVVIQTHDSTGQVRNRMIYVPTRDRSQQITGWALEREEALR